MKCLFDLSFIRYNIYAGVSKYAYRILDYVVEANKTGEFVLLLNSISEKQIREWYPQFEYIVIGSGILKKIPIIRTLALSVKFKRIVNQTSCDVVFCPWGNEISCLPVDKVKISVIHDLQLRLDLKGINLWIHKQIDDRVMKYSDKIVTISEFSKNQILSFYPNAPKDFVISLGNSVSVNEYKGKRLLDEDYILYVGRICKMKNVETLVKAFCLIHPEIPNTKLVIVGKRNDYWYHEILPILEKYNCVNRVNIVENCSENDLTLWYRYAKLFVFPSLREGFGSPPLEAAIEMCPVLSSTCDSLEEVLMNKVYTYSNPCNEQELGKCIYTILKSDIVLADLRKIRDFYISNYSVEVIGKRIYNYLLANSK